VRRPTKKPVQHAHEPASTTRWYQRVRHVRGKHSLPQDPTACLGRPDPATLVPTPRRRLY
jgi:hypothetical protein